MCDMEGVTEMLECACRQKKKLLMKISSPTRKRRTHNKISTYIDHQSICVLLVTKTRNDANTKVGNTKLHQGVLAWQKIASEYGRIIPQARRKLLQMVTWPKPAKTLEELATAKENWERNLRRYKEACPGGHMEMEDVLIIGFQNLLPHKLLEQTHIVWTGTSKQSTK